MEASPTKGAGSDDTHRGNGSVAGIAQWDTSGKVIVRTGSSNADAIQFCPLSLRSSLLGRSRSQSERDLAVPEAAGRRAEGRASGKSDGTRSDRSETSGGAVAVVAVASEAVCCGAAGCRSTESLLTVETGDRRRVLCPECLSSFVRREAR